MSRSLALGSCAAVLAVAGCRQEGSYRVSWDFLSDASPGASEQSAAAGCGQHGVDAIWVFATDTSADSDQVFAICTAGQASRTVPVGTWTVSVKAIDAQRALIPAVLPLAPIPDLVVGDGTMTDLAVTLTVPPACNDGIDNDGDGWVDLADPDCAGDPAGSHE